MKSRIVRTWPLSFVGAGLAVAVIACGGGERPDVPQPSGAAETTTGAAPAVTSTPATPPAATAAAAVAAPAAGLDPTGAYFSMTELPAEFQELEHLSLATIDENAAPAPLNGFLRPKAKSAGDYKLVTPALSGTSLSFTTTAVNGVHYTFSGAFQRIANFAETPPSYEDVALSGTLTKHRDGQTVATTPVNFRYEAGG